MKAMHGTLCDQRSRWHARARRLPDLTDHEIRAEIVYMFNPDLPAKK